MFCQIARKEIPAAILYESRSVMAILDASPLSRGHALVIPKAHHRLIQDVNAETGSEMFEATSKLAERTDRLGDGTLISIHNGRGAGQEIDHVHVHLIPRYKGDGANAVHAMFSKRPAKGQKYMEEYSARLQN